ncbi:peptidase-like [Trichodesmium erythraeum IMS101]|uniref:Peptidase-like n=1 Tax=Trichodesmium erythraeum (strain IMS101) TaxID=203124 RepID=Q115A1_TRIEI|nr:PPC domain-containing protein [Trichodesmium sp. ALOHA_ZT_67]
MSVQKKSNKSLRSYSLATISDNGSLHLTVGEYDKLLVGGIQLSNGKNFDPGNSKDKAFNIGSLSDKFQLDESVGKSDRQDFYKFTVEEQRKVEIKLMGLTANADLYLLPEKGKVIDKSKNGGKKNEKITATLEPDTTYYLQVQPRNKTIKMLIIISVWILEKQQIIL